MTTSVHCENFSSSIKRFSLKDGLPETNIFSMAQDETGFIWLGTPSGLVRYDGYEFRRYSNDANSQYPLVFSDAGQIFIDSKGRYWIGSWGEGLAVYNKKMQLLGKYAKNDLINSSSGTTYSNSIIEARNNSYIMSNRIQTFFEDSDGDIWVGTSGGGLALFIPETNSFKSYLTDETKHDSISHNRVWCIVESQPGILWVATSKGLNKLNKKTETFTRFYHEPSNPTSLRNSLITTLHVVKNIDTNNTLWIGTETGLGIFDTQTEKFTSINPKNTSITNFITRIRQDKNNNLWIGTQKGLYKYDLNHRKFITLSNTNKLSNLNNYQFFTSDDIRDIVIDSSGLLWLGNRLTGLIKADLKPTVYDNTSHYVEKNGIRKRLNGVRAIYVDKANVLWLSTKDGIFYKNNETGFITRFASSDRLINLPFFTIGENKAGELWLGGPNGLYKIDKQRKIMTDQNKLLEKIKVNGVMSLLFDEDNNLWLGTLYSGLVRIDADDEKSTFIFTADDNSPDSLNSNNINSIYQDSFKRIWVGTHGGGLARLNPLTNNFVNYVHQPMLENSISNNSISTIYQTKDGNVWIGTKRSLDRYNGDNDNFEHFDVPNGLTNSNIKAMFEDNVGNLWLSTNAGISQLDSTRKKIINYDFNNDFQNDGFLERSAYKGQDGSLFFGGNRGITKITPAQVKLNKHIPSVVITDVWIDNDLSNQYTMEQKQPLNLSFGIKNVKIRFAAIDFQDPINNMHSYRLIGFDDEWSQVSNSNDASFTNLVPGEYDFEVKGSNNSNVWNPEVTRLKIIINYPWWKRWWAYTIYTLILISIVLTFLLIHRNKVRFERNLNLKLEKKVIEVQEKNREIEEKKREVEKKNEEILTIPQLVQSEKMSSLGTLTAGVAHEINNPTNYVNAAVYMMKDEINIIKTFLKQLAGGDKADPKILQSFDEKFTKLIGLTETATEGTKRIKIIVEDLRTFARMDEIKESQVHISELITSTVHLVKTQYDSITIKTQFDYDPLMTCLSSKLNQVFMNMIVNACQAVKSNDEVLKLESSKVTSYQSENLKVTSYQSENLKVQHLDNNQFKGLVIISLEQGDNELVIRFKDNGCGMDEATLIKIFEPFYTTKEVGEGTGLGLAISFGIIQDHGGRIEVISNIGDGATFSIYLPICLPF